jgi:hypothetical protein
MRSFSVISLIVTDPLAYAASQPQGGAAPMSALAPVDAGTHERGPLGDAVLATDQVSDHGLAMFIHTWPTLDGSVVQDVPILFM